MKYIIFFIDFYELNYHILEELFEEYINDNKDNKVKNILIEFGLKYEDLDHDHQQVVKKWFS